MTLLIVSFGFVPTGGPTHAAAQPQTDNSPPTSDTNGSTAINSAQKFGVNPPKSYNRDAKIRCQKRKAPQTLDYWIKWAARNHEKRGYATNRGDDFVVAAAANHAVDRWIVDGNFSGAVDAVLTITSSLDQHGLEHAGPRSKHLPGLINDVRRQLDNLHSVASDANRVTETCAMATSAGIDIKETFLEIFSILAQIEQRVVPRGERFSPSYLNRKFRIALDNPLSYQDSLFPTHPEYHTLMTALARYKTIVAGGGWDDMSPEERLYIQGWLTTPDCADDLDLSRALMDFQDYHGLVTSGQLDAPTVAALSVSASERLRHIMVALERWRQSPTRHQQTYLRINIPAFVVEHWRDGQRVSVRRTVVGSIQTPTTPMDRKITHVQVNPPWYVPWSVQETDLRRRAEADPSFYDRNGFRRLPGRGLMQPPGSGNWLGQVIFRWSGPGLIFIHDTPFQERFERPIRCYSHGCVHAESAEELARTLIVDDGVMSGTEFDAALASGVTKRIRLRAPLPTYLEYVTVRTDDRGRVGFLPDVYGLDALEMRHVEAPVVAKIRAQSDRRL